MPQLPPVPEDLPLSRSADTLTHDETPQSTDRRVPSTVGIGSHHFFTTQALPSCSSSYSPRTTLSLTKPPIIRRNLVPHPQSQFSPINVAATFQPRTDLKHQSSRQIHPHTVTTYSYPATARSSAIAESPRPLGTAAVNVNRISFNPKPYLTRTHSTQSYLTQPYLTQSYSSQPYSAQPHLTQPHSTQLYPPQPLSARLPRESTSPLHCYLHNTTCQPGLYREPPRYSASSVSHSHAYLPARNVTWGNEYGRSNRLICPGIGVNVHAAQNSFETRPLSARGHNGNRVRFSPEDGEAIRRACQLKINAINDAGLIELGHREKLAMSRGHTLYRRPAGVSSRVQSIAEMATDSVNLVPAMRLPAEWVERRPAAPVTSTEAFDSGEATSTAKYTRGQHLKGALMAPPPTIMRRAATRTPVTRAHSMGSTMSILSKSVSQRFGL